MKLPEPIGWSYLFEDDGSLCQQFDTREEADRWVDSPDCLWSGYVSPLYSEAQVKELLARAEAFEEAAKAVLDAEPLESVPQAMQTVIAAMQADPSYAWSWHCNVAMTYVDAGGDRYTGNQGAARFMKLLANVDPAHELPEKPAPAQEPVAFVSLDDLDAMCNPEYAPGAHFRMRKTPAGKYVQPIYTAPQAQQPAPPAEVPLLTDAVRYKKLRRC